MPKASKKEKTGKNEKRLAKREGLNGMSKAK
jgi:hypothetical protein